MYIFTYRAQMTPIFEGQPAQWKQWSLGSRCRNIFRDAPKIPVPVASELVKFNIIVKSKMM